MDEAWETTEACLAQHPKEGRARYFKAFLLQRQGKNSEAETALRDLIKDPLLSLDNQANAWHLLGTVLDAVGQYKEAMESLKKSKALRRQTVNAAAMESNYDTMVASRQTLLAELKPEMVQRWREEAKETSCPHPLVLLGGPPRSGTTLFEQILAAHPEIIVFDEPHSFFNELLNRVNPPPPAPGLTLSRLNALTADERTYLIGRYLKSLLRETDEFPGAKLLLDKNPSTTGSLHLWIRLFPFSKNIIALRDPRDNVISCFFQNIPVSAANVSFLSLERTAQYYAHRMEVWLRMKELGGFEWIETRYEDIVRDLEGEGRRITSFLGLTWNDAQAKYYERARQKFVHSPTYDEVSKPVYKRAVGRWEHYAEELAPFQGILEPYLKHFGYA
jgi:tetratricopeptide (TPR) repeat protein